MNPHAPDTSTRAFFRLAWPIFIANLAMVGGATIDTVMAGRLSPIDLAGVAVGSSIYVTIFIGLMGITQALSPIVGHHFGARRWRAIGDDVQQALWLVAMLTLFGLPWLLATDLWVSLSRADDDVAAVTTSYLVAVAFGLAAALANRVFVALNASVSRPKVTMVINLAALALKVPLNALFMEGAGPIPALGGGGAGVATALIAWFSFGAAALIWRWDTFYDRFRCPTLHGIRWSSQRELLRLGIPIGLSTLFEVSSFTIMAVLIARLGATAVAGHQIVANLISLLFMVPLAIGISASVLVAQSLGADDPRTARRATLRGFRLSVGIALATALSIWVFRHFLISLYTTDAAVIGVALSLIGLAAIFHLFDAFQGVAVFTLRGYKTTFWPMIVYGVALWGIGVAGGYWLAFSTTPFGPPRGARGFWEAATLALAIAAVALTWLTFAVSARRVRRAGDA